MKFKIDFNKIQITSNWRFDESGDFAQEFFVGKNKVKIIEHTFVYKQDKNYTIKYSDLYKNEVYVGGRYVLYGSGNIINSSNNWRGLFDIFDFEEE